MSLQVKIELSPKRETNLVVMKIEDMLMMMKVMGMTMITLAHSLHTSIASPRSSQERNFRI